MIRFNKILVPTDFSEGAERAYAAAQQISSIFGGKIDFLHIVPTLTYLSESMKKMGVPIDMDQDLFPHIFRDSRHKMEQLMEDYISENSRGSIDVRTDRKVAAAITTYAKENHYDLIVMGAKGSHGTALTRGSVTERVIRKSSVPVFSTNTRVDAQSMSNIVVSTDGSQRSLSAFPMAVALAQVFDASVTLYHVIELYGSHKVTPKFNHKDEQVSTYEFLINELQTFLDEQRIESIHLHRTGVTGEDQITITDGRTTDTLDLHTVIQKGITAHVELEAYVNEHGDLLLTATHGHSGLAHFFLGSTAEKVALHVNKPVITIRPNDKLFETPRA